MRSLRLPGKRSLPVQDDRIYASTRIISAAIVPFLLVAFLILYVTPDRSGERFAWEIRPQMTAAFMGAGYLGGAWLFLNAIFGRRWHHIAAGFLPVATFTIFMLLATLLHWDRFDLAHFPFLLWLSLYLVTPLLVPVMWLHNRPADPVTPDPEERLTPPFAGRGLQLLGAGLFAYAILGFISPGFLISIWPWELTPLTARVMAGWFALLGVGGLVIGRETRWSSWRAGMQSIGLWHLLVLFAAVMHREDFPGGLLNWYLASVALVLLGMVILYLAMTIGRRRRPHAQVPSAPRD